MTSTSVGGEQQIKNPLKGILFFCSYFFCIFFIYNNRTDIEGGEVVKSHIEQRAVTIAKYILEKQSTVRQTAKVFGVSKSTVHKDVTERLEEIQPTLASEVKQILEKNKSERHIRGGMATKLKYQQQKKM